MHYLEIAKINPYVTVAAAYTMFKFCVVQSPTQKVCEERLVNYGQLKQKICEDVFWDTPSMLQECTLEAFDVTHDDSICAYLPTQEDIDLFNELGLPVN